MNVLMPRLRQHRLSPRWIPFWLSAVLLGGCRGEPNLPPTANAGSEQIVSPAASVTLDGSASNDPENDTLSFTWRQTLGPAVALSTATEPQVTFAAPAISTNL